MLGEVELESRDGECVGERGRKSVGGMVVVVG